MLSHVKPSKSLLLIPLRESAITKSLGSAFLRLVASVLLAGLCLASAPTLVSAQTGAAATAIKAYEGKVRVNRDGTLRVSETWETSASGTLRRGIITRRHFQNDVDHVVEISGVKATAGNKTVTAGVLTQDDVTTISVEGTGKVSKVMLTYDVRGAVAVAPSGGTELVWTPLHGLPGVQRARITLSSPELSYIRCSAGPLGAEHPCTLSQISESIPVFEQRELAEGDSMTIVAGFAEGEVDASTIVEYRKSLRRAFLADPLHLGATAAVLLLGGAALYLLHRRRGRDPIDPMRVVPASLFGRNDGTVVFDPPQGLRPGEIGTLIDERVDPVDITSTILDLAVRGHLRITELPKNSEFARADWLLARSTAPPDGMQGFEAKLLDGVFGAVDEVKVSEIGPRVRESLGQVQEALYDEVVAHGWFTERPDRARTKWSTAGIATLAGGLLLTVLLALLSTWGLLGLAVTVLGAGLLVLGGHMPSKSPEAGRVVGQVASLRGELMELDPAALPAERHAELCARALPYAVVLGGADRWIDALVATDTDETPDDGFHWYRGPANWHLRDLPDSLKNFSVSLTGAMFSR